MGNEWVQLVLGQGGALILLILIGNKLFKYLTDMISKQDAKSDLREKRYDELHTSTLEHIAAHTAELKRLSDNKGLYCLYNENPKTLIKNKG